MAFSENNRVPIAVFLRPAGQRPAHTCSFEEPVMKRVFVAAAAAVLGTAIYLPAAIAGDAASVAVTSRVAEDAAARAPHYAWQYHYVGHHPRYEGHWVLVR
jgi:hypothetical protein